MDMTYVKPSQPRYVTLPYSLYCLRRCALLGQFYVSPNGEIYA